MKLKNLWICAAAVITVSCMAGCASNTSTENKSTTGAAQAETTALADDKTTAVDDSESKVTYMVKVVDEDGKAIANAMVQICMDSCIPGKTDENGVATFKVAKAEYKASLISLPEGYAYTTDETDFYFENEKTDLTITLKLQ